MTKVNPSSRCLVVNDPCHISDYHKKSEWPVKEPFGDLLNHFFGEINNFEKTGMGNCKHWILYECPEERFFGIPLILCIRGHETRIFYWISDKQKKNSGKGNFASGVFPIEDLGQAWRDGPYSPNWSNFISMIRENSSQLEIFGLNFETIRELCVDPSINQTGIPSDLEIDREVIISSEGIYIDY